MPKPQDTGSIEELRDAGLETQLVHGGALRSQFGEVSEAIFMNSGFCYDSAETAEKPLQTAVAFVAQPPSP